jgi:hypothetical protein
VHCGLRASTSRWQRSASDLNWLLKPLRSGSCEVFAREPGMRLSRAHTRARLSRFNSRGCGVCGSYRDDGREVRRRHRRQSCQVSRRPAHCPLGRRQHRQRSFRPRRYHPRSDAGNDRLVRGRIGHSHDDAQTPEPMR